MLKLKLIMKYCMQDHGDVEHWHVLSGYRHTVIDYYRLTQQMNVRLGMISFHYVDCSYVTLPRHLDIVYISCVSNWLTDNLSY